MRRVLLRALPLLAPSLLICAAASGCAPPCPPDAPGGVPAAAPSAAAPAAPAVPVQAAPAPPTDVAEACKGAEHREFDFWIGQWNLVVKTRKAPGSDEWVEAPATNRIQSTLGGCAVEESFRAEGPGSPWAGRSFSAYVGPKKVWRQTWVDDQGSYLAFTGGMESGRMVLRGESFKREDKEIQMRMVFSDITAGSLTWTWERTNDGGATWTPVMIILYTRASP